MPIDIYIDRASEKLSSISFYFPYIQWTDIQNDFYINGCLPLFKDIDKKKWFWSPKNHHPIPTVPIGVSRGSYAGQCQHSFPQRLGVSWTLLGWVCGFNRWDLYQRHLRGKVVDNEKNLSKLHGFFLDVLGITWHWMKWHEITTWLGDFSGKAATSGSANILNTSDSLTAQCSTWPFFWVLRRNRCSMSVPKTPRRKMILFFVNFSCLFSFYGSSPDFMGGLLLLQTRSFGQTPLANVFSVYPWEKLIQDHNFYIKNVGTHLFK